METKDKRVKREIANSNERRRMQSINAGFQKLKRLLPVNDGEKLSKASILQHASDFIQQTEREKLILYEQNTLLRGILMDIKSGTDITTALHTIDLDALPTIPINTHSHTNNNSINSPIDPNNNDDCIRGISSSNSSSSAINNNNSTSTNTNNVHTNNRNAHRNTSNNKEVNKNNGNQNRDIAAAIQATTAATTTTSTPTTIITTIPPSAATTTTSNRANNNTTIKQELPITCPKNGVAKAAIALPLEVPCYTRLDLLIHAASSDLSK